MIEVYFKDEDSLAKYKGTNNSLTADCPGIRLTVNFNGEFEDEYRGRLVENKEISRQFRTYQSNITAFKDITSVVHRFYNNPIRSKLTLSMEQTATIPGL